MLQKNTLLLIAGISLITTSCSHMSSQEKKYLDSQHGKQLVVPSHLAKEKIKQDYVIPHIEGAAGVITLPPDTALSPEEKAQVSKEAAKHIEHIPLSQAVPASQMTLQQTQTYPAIVIKQPLDQAWISVATGLRRKYMKIVSASEANKKFCIARGHFTRDGHMQNATPACIHLEALDKNTTRIFVLDDAGQPIDPKAAVSILQLLQLGMEARLRFTLPKIFSW